MASQSYEQDKRKGPQMTYEEAEKGDPAAYKRVYPAVVRQAALIVGPHAAPDVVQEALIGLFIALPKKTPSDFASTGDSVVPFLRKIVEYKAGAHLKALHASKRDSRLTMSVEAMGIDPISTSDVEAEVLGKTGGEEMEEHLRRKVRKPELREALLLVDFGVSSEEGAEMQGVPVGTFKSRVHQARARARIGLQREG